MAQLASLVLPNIAIPQRDFSWIGSIADSVGGAVDEFGQRRSYGKLADLIGEQPQAATQQPSGGFLSSLAPQTAQPSQTAAAPVMPVQRGPIPDTYYASIRSAESGGNDAAKNPRSSATGRYQFTEGTWNGLMQQHPELALTADGRLDPNQQERAIRAFTQNNAQTLSRAGIPVNPGNLYAAHFLGSGGATSVLGQDDNAPISNFVGADVIQANPFLNGMTVGQFKQWSAEKGGRAGGGYNAPSAMDAVNELASGGGAPLSDQAFDDRFGPSVAPVVGAEALSAALSGGEAAATEQPAAYAPNQVADASGSFAGVPGVQPIPRGGVNPEIIQFMLRDPNLREAGLKLWAQNATGKTGDDWQFIQGSNGDLLRANQMTGQIERVGNFARPEETKPPQIVELFDEQTGQPYKARYNPQTMEYERVGGVKAPSGFSVTTNPDGTVSVTQGPQQANPKLTEQQSKDLVYYRRGSGALSTLDQIADNLTSLPGAIADKVWGGNYLKSADYQKAQQSGMEFLQAILRKDTGAAITKQEQDEYGKVYLPQPGDGASVLLQKKEARARALEAIRKGLGPAEILAGERPTETQGKTARVAPQAGAVEDGYRFRGGDPADPNNWEPAQ